MFGGTAGLVGKFTKAASTVLPLQPATKAQMASTLSPVLPTRHDDKRFQSFKDRRFSKMLRKLQYTYKQKSEDSFDSGTSSQEANAVAKASCNEKSSSMISADGLLTSSRTFQPKILISNSTKTTAAPAPASNQKPQLWRRPLHSLLERTYTLPAASAVTMTSTSMIIEEPTATATAGLQHLLISSSSAAELKRQKTCPEMQ